MFAGRIFTTLAVSFYLATVASGKLTVNNIASQISRRPAAGEYYMENVKTGQRMTYLPDDGHQFWPASGKGSKVFLKYKGKLAVISPGYRNKCWSAQWAVIKGTGRDWAAALYDCGVVGFHGLGNKKFQGNVRDGPVRDAKQLSWIVKSGKGHKIGNCRLSETPNLLSKVTTDHSKDMPLRCVTGKTVRAKFNNKIRMAALEPCVAGDKSQDWLFIKA